MSSLNDMKLNFNSRLKMNFDGGDLTSDAGLLLLREFDEKIGFSSLIKSKFKTNDSALFRIHSDADNLLQKLYQKIATYFSDDDADELTKEPLFTTILAKDALTSQPTLSRFFNRMDDNTLKQIRNPFIIAYKNLLLGATRTHSI